MEPSPGAENVFGMLMETNSPRIGFPILSISIKDGTTSLYYGKGGGLMGLIKYPAVVQMTKKFVEEGEKNHKKLSSTTEYPITEKGNVRFFALTFSGVRTVEVEEKELQTGEHELSKLYTCGQEVITQIRLTQEKKGG